MKRAVLVLLMAGDIHAKERPYSQSSVLIPALGMLDGTVEVWRECSDGKGLRDYVDLQRSSSYRRFVQKLWTCRNDVLLFCLSGRLEEKMPGL